MTKYNAPAIQKLKMTKTLITLIAFASMNAVAATNLSSANPGDACRSKENAISYAMNGDALACRNNKLVVIAPAPMVGQPCWGGPNSQAIQGATGTVVCKRIADHAEWRPANETAEPGSADAVRAMIPVYLGQLLTKVDAPVVKGDAATVHVRILDRSCNLALVKNSTANESGWVVVKQNCNKR